MGEGGGASSSYRRVQNTSETLNHSRFVCRLALLAFLWTDKRRRIGVFLSELIVLLQKALQFDRWCWENTDCFRLQVRQMLQHRMFCVFDIFISLLSKPPMSDNSILHKVAGKCWNKRKWGTRAVLQKSDYNTMPELSAVYSRHKDKSEKENKTKQKRKSQKKAKKDKPVWKACSSRRCLSSMTDSSPRVQRARVCLTHQLISHGQV